jgi:hypothetical protein
VLLCFGTLFGGRCGRLLLLRTAIQDLEARSTSNAEARVGIAIDEDSA